MNIGDSHSMGEAIRFESSSRIRSNESTPKQREFGVSEGAYLEIPKSYESDRNKDIGRIDKLKLKESIEDINKDIEPFNTKLKYSIHEKTHQVMVKIVDRNTDEIVKEIPPEKLADMRAKLLEMAGLIVDDRA